MDDQFRRAWNEGARDVGFEPADMTDDDKLEYMLRAEQEKEHILGFADAVEQAFSKDVPIDAMYSRADMWSQRYREVQIQARTYFGGKQRLEWVLGASEHCSSCLTLAGTVATADEWDIARGRGVYPKSNSLECGGFHCQCSLQPTNRYRSKGGIPYLGGLRWSQTKQPGILCSLRFIRRITAG